VKASAARSTGTREQFRMRWQLMEQYPELLPRLFARMEDFKATLATAVAARCGAEGRRPGVRDAAGDAAAGAYPQLMASVALATMRVAVDRWLAGHGDQSLEDHVAGLFGLLTTELGESAKGGVLA
jgi:hypothetical protein